MTSRLLAAAACLLAATGCSTLQSGPSGEELVDRTVQVVSARNQVTRLGFRDDGRVTAAFGTNRLQGRWRVAGRKLCFFWQSAPRECWPYRSRFERGRTRSLTSDRGNVVRVTLL